MDKDIWCLVLQNLNTKEFLTMYMISKEFTKYALNQKLNKKWIIKVKTENITKLYQLNGNCKLINLYFDLDLRWNKTIINKNIKDMMNITSLDLYSNILITDK